MPRWVISVSPPSSRTSRYFARRASDSDPPPLQPLGEARRERSAQVARAATRPWRSARRPSPARGRAAPFRPRAAQASACSRITARKADPYRCSLAAPTPCRLPEAVERRRPRPSPSRSASAVGEDDVGRLLLRRGDRAAQRPSARRAARRRPRWAQRCRRAASRRAFLATTSSRRANGASPLQHPRPSSVTIRRSRSAPSCAISLRRQQLPQHAAPVGRRAVVADAEGLELVVAVALDRFARLARQDVGEMAEEEPPRRAQHGRQRLLRLDACRRSAAPRPGRRRNGRTARNPRRTCASSVCRRQRAVSHKATSASSLPVSIRLRSSGAPPSAIWRRRSSMSPAP